MQSRGAVWQFYNTKVQPTRLQIRGGELFLNVNDAFEMEPLGTIKSLSGESSLASLIKGILTIQ